MYKLNHMPLLVTIDNVICSNKEKGALRPFIHLDLLCLMQYGVTNMIRMIYETIQMMENGITLSYSGRLISINDTIDATAVYQVTYFNPLTICAKT